MAALISDAADVDVCFVHLLDPDRKRLTLTGATPPFDRLAGRISLSVQEGVSGWVARNAEPAVITDNKLSDPRYRYIPELRGEKYTSMASVPMVSRPGTLVGVLNVHTRERRHLGRADVQLLTSIASLAAGAIENARLHRRVAQREQAREQFAERMVALQESERRRLAAEIHDGISQRIVGLSFHLAAGADAVATDPAFAATQIAAARKLADAALEETRLAIVGLRPPVLDDLGLAASLESLARSFGELSVEVDIDPAPMPEHVETALYRIAQEGLQNVAKHAEAREVRVELVAGDDGRKTLSIVDDGAGFDPDQERPEASRVTYGLAGMRERADLIGGELHIESRPGRGTRVSVTIPGRPADLAG